MTMRPPIVIVADDLTGAADCGITCTAAGLETVVVAFGDLARAAELSADVIAFDTDTRRAAPEAAAAQTAAAVNVLCARGATRVLYKKIDSTLRGNFAAEIGAARRAAGGIFAENTLPLAIVAPAFPGTGRTTRCGRMFLGDIPLEDSAVWKNEKITGVADVPAMLRRAGLRAASVDLGVVRAGPRGLAAALDRLIAGGVEAAVMDAETEEDLRTVAQAAARLINAPIFAGSAGLARHLPAAFGLARAEADPHVERNEALSALPLLFVVGSMSEVSREGLRALAQEPGVREFSLAPAMFRAGEDSAAWRQDAAGIAEALAAGEDVALAIALEEGVDLAESAFLSEAFARFILPLTSRVGGAFLTGGETARSLLGAVGAAGIRLLGEVESGVPLGLAKGWDDRPVITKAGAFGSAQTLVRARAALRSFLGRE